MASGVPGEFSDRAQHEFFYRPSLNQSIHVFNLGLHFGLRPAVAVDAMQRLIGLVATGAVTVRVGETLPLSRAAEAHERLESRATTGKVILHPWS